VPATWSWLLRVLETHPAATRGVVRALGAADAGLLSLAADRPELIVSTHPFASQALGALRAAGRLDVPVATYLTDMSVHPLWVHPSVDLHLALHDLPAAEAGRRGAGRTTVVRPAVPDVPVPGSAATLPARRALGLPADEPLVLVVGGSCGIGDLERTAREVAATGLAVPVVLCGRNDRLRARVAAGGHAVALGWVDDVPALLGAVDAVVQNAGGFTSLETLAAGVPVLSYRCIAGHGQTNARTLDAAGLVPWARSRPELSPLLAGLLLAGRRPGAPATWGRRPDVVDALSPYLRTPSALVPAGGPPYGSVA
jgi:UDP-N-acetylglucosamine:LPS N-acetylglucosamine transferase